jgi:hypothetical protein
MATTLKPKMAKLCRLVDKKPARMSLDSVVKTRLGRLQSVRFVMVLSVMLGEVSVWVITDGQMNLGFSRRK